MPSRTAVVSALNELLPPALALGALVRRVRCHVWYVGGPGAGR